MPRLWHKNKPSLHTVVAIFYEPLASGCSLRLLGTIELRNAKESRRCRLAKWRRTFKYHGIFCFSQTYLCLVSARSEGPGQADSQSTTYFIPREAQPACHLQQWDVCLDSNTVAYLGTLLLCQICHSKFRPFLITPCPGNGHQSGYIDIGKWIVDTGVLC